MNCAWRRSRSGTEASAPAADDPLDPHHLEALGLLAAGGDPVLEDVLGVFRTTVPERVEELGTALLAADATAANRIAHALVGSCGAVGARRLAALCSEVEVVAGEGRVDDGRRVLPGLRRELEAVQAAVERVLAGEPPPGAGRG